MDAQHHGNGGLLRSGHIFIYVFFLKVAGGDGPRAGVLPCLSFFQQGIFDEGKDETRVSRSV